MKDDGGKPARVGVVLCTYGEPTRNSWSEQWMYSYRILQRLTRKVAKIPPLVLPLIATIRARQRVRQWQEHGFLSPLEPFTDQTVAALQTELDARTGGGVQHRVSRAYEFRRPMLTDVLPQLHEEGCERFILVPMYVGSGDFTDGMTRLAVAEALPKLTWLQPERITWGLLGDTDPTRDRLADVLADHLLQSVRERGLVLPAPDWAVLLAAHGTVVSPMPGVDNGLLSFAQVGTRVFRRIRRHFGRVSFGWLNHTKGGRWTEPSVQRCLHRIRQAGFEQLVYFPWGFTTDNAETALEGRILCKSTPQPFRRVEHLPCLNTHPDFVRFLAHRLQGLI